MIRTIALTTALLLSVGICLGQVAKTETPERIAVVDPSKFTARGSGIARLVAADHLLGSVDTECTFKCLGLEKEIAELERKLGSSNNPDLQKRLDEARVNLNRMELAHAAAYRRTEQLIWIPALNSVKNKQREFARANGYDALIEKYDPSILFIDKALPDVTAEFIRFCNDSLEREKGK